MGGYCSTRWNLETTRQDTAGLLCLDVRTLNRQGALQAGALASQHWTRGDGAPAGTITTSCDGDTLTLTYQTQRYGEPAWTPVRERVPLDTTPCHFGGKRVWFRCPGCLSRRAVLFSVGGRFRCRRCHDLAYASTRQNAIDRGTNRIRHLQRNLHAPVGCTPWHIPEKPDRMHWQTYERLVFELRIAIARRDALLGAKMDALVQRSDALLTGRESVRR